MKKDRQKILVVAFMGVAICVAVVGIGVIWKHFSRAESAAALVLSSQARPTSLWSVETTRKGVLFRATAGRYRGWYLDADESYAPHQLGPEHEAAANRFLGLSRSRKDSTYFTVVRSRGSATLRVAGGSLKGSYLDIASSDQPRRHGDLHFARNLLVGGVQLGWALVGDGKTVRIQTSAMDGVKPWFIDTDDDLSDDAPLVPRPETTRAGMATAKAAASVLTREMDVSVFR